MFRLHDSLQPLHSNLVKQLSIFIIHEDLSALGPNQELLGGGRPADECNGDLILLSPLAVSLDASHDDVSVLIGDADLGAIRTPFHVLDYGCFSIVDHFLDPLSIMFHKNNDGARGIACCQLAVLVIPDDVGDVSRVVGQICALVPLGAVALDLEAV